MKIGTVSVTHNPDLAILKLQLAALPVEAFKIIVDNASPPDIGEALREFLAKQPGTLLITNTNNIGLAAALNQGVHALQALVPDAMLVLLLDQDSEPEPGGVQALIDAHVSLQAQGHQVGAVGPQLRDASTGLKHGFHQMTRWRWRRVFPSTDDTVPISVTNLNGCGTLMLIQLFQQLGGLDEGLFIDHVDTEWSFRLLAGGHSLWGIPNAVFTHRMGQRGIRFWWFGWRVWPARSSLRHRYLFRNTLWLLQRSYVPCVWKGWAVVKLLLTVIAHALLDKERRGQLAAMWEGVREGWRPQCTN